MKKIPLYILLSLLLVSCNIFKGKSSQKNSSAQQVAATPTFDTWNFVLWDYADEVTTDPSTAQAHWKTLIGFVQQNKIRRVITFIKDPSQYPFYSINQTPDQQYFIYWAKTFAAQCPSCDLQVFFDRTAFNSQITTHGPTDLPSPFASITTTNFLNLPDKMTWVWGMLGMGVPIKEVDLDPECSFNTPSDCGSAPNLGGGMGAKQLLINFMNYYRYQNSRFSNVRLGVCLGFDVKSLTFLNLSTLPLPSNGDEYDLNQLLPANCNYYNFPTKIAPTTWWGANSPAPLLDSVYIEAYDHSIPYNFTLQSNPTLAATNMLHLYRDEPYMPGSGLISFSSTSKQLTGINTQFLTQGVTDGTPFGVVQGPSMTTIGLVNGSLPITNTSATFYSNATLSGNSMAYSISESPIKWVFPSVNPKVNPQLLNNICFMFSLEPNPVDQQPNTPYFGTWTLDQFLLFMATFYSQGQTALPIYTQSSYPDPTVYTPLPKNFGIYDFRQLQANPNFSSLFPQ